MQNSSKLFGLSPHDRVNLKAQSGYRDAAIIIGIMSLATVLRLYQLGTESVWIDEMLSIRDAEEFTLSIPYTRPLFYALLKFWMLFGGGDAWLRTLAVVFGLGSILLTYQLGKVLVSKSVAYVAAFLMAISPLFINHSQEIRMYSLISFLSVLGTLVFVRMLQNPSSGKWGGWVAARVLLVISNSNNLLILAADGLLAAWTFRRQRKWLVFCGLGFCIIGVFLLPIVMSLTVGGEVEQFGEDQTVEGRGISLLHLGGMVAQLTVYYPLRYLLESSQIEVSKSNLDSVSAIQQFLGNLDWLLLLCGVATLLVSGLLILSIVAIYKHRTKPLIWLLVWAIVPLLFMVMGSFVHVAIWSPRYLLFIAPYLLILLSMGFVILWHWRQKLAIISAIVYCVATIGCLYDYYTVLYRNDWKGATAYLEQNVSPGDAIAFYSIGGLADQSFFRYYDNENNPVKGRLVERYRPEGAPPDADFQLDEADVQAVAEAIGSESNSVWLTCWLYCNDTERINQIFEQTLGEDFSVEEHVKFASQEYSPIEIYRAVAQ